MSVLPILTSSVLIVEPFPAWMRAMSKTQILTLQKTLAQSRRSCFVAIATNAKEQISRNLTEFSWQFGIPRGTFDGLTPQS